MTERSSRRPSLELVLGPAGAGKTLYAVRRYRSEPARTLFITATQVQADRALMLLEAKASPNTVMSLQEFIGRLMEGSGVEMVGRSFQRLLLQDIIERWLYQDDYLAPMRFYDGFLSAMLEQIREWKLSGLSPEDIQAMGPMAVEETGNPREADKFLELARLYGAYERFLKQHRRQDAEGMLLLAKERLQAGPVRWLESFDTLILDGFYSLYPAQSTLLTMLAERFPQMQFLVTLLYDPERPLLFASAEPTIRRLKADFQCRETFLNMAQPPLSVADVLALCLFHETRSKPLADANLEPILLFDAPDVYMEAEMVARAFQNLHDTGKYQWSDFAVVVRNVQAYAPTLVSVFERYGVPIGTFGGEPVAENPLIRSLITFLDIVRHDWPRDAVLTFFKSSYTQPSYEEVERLRLLANEKGIRQGKEEWAALLPDLAPSSAQLLDTMLNRSERLLQAQSVQHLAEEIEILLEDFGLKEAIALGEPLQQRRDQEACRVAMETLYSMADMMHLTDREQMPFGDFVERLISAWHNSTVVVGLGEDQVWISEPYDIHQRRPRVVAVMGLLERLFPRRLTENPFLPDAVRRRLYEQTGLYLAPREARVNEERLLFYLAVTAPSERLILSYPRSSGEADTLPSFYLEEVKQALESRPELLHVISRRLADVAPRSEDAGSWRERLLNLCVPLFDPAVSEERRAEVQTMVKRLCAENLSAVELLRAVAESRFLPPLPRVEEETTRTWIREKTRRCSLAELEVYALCPFRHFLQYRLQLRVNIQTSFAMLQAKLLRDVLYRAFSELSVADGQPLEEALLEKALKAELQNLVADISPHRKRLLWQGLMRLLKAIADKEQFYSRCLPLQPLYFRLAFGVPHANSAMYDPNSSAQPLIIPDPQGGEPLALYGVVDRIDREANGDFVFLMDYTTAPPPSLSDITSGKAIRWPLMMLALERLFGMKVGGLCIDFAAQNARTRLFRTSRVAFQRFKLIPEREKGDQVQPLNDEQYKAMQQAAIESAIHHANAMRQGYVAARPGTHCRFCPYSDICRTTPQGHDGEPLYRLEGASRADDGSTGEMDSA
ncbi:PD-(D/E)XK nuclease family protein [Chthonomonas calidirosea]|uniref:PD-(D/E)XK nuclease family protein n=1 Tax=Chthonomonas calidirosea TaxID=454171 RepID=UPI0006ECC766|nr:PD-(D/E)XK nuclease family protein [Chthonomonas calidirosea]CEK20666.1 DNA helicase/exodeoxyribonuclease V, subunit B [Chthonomonas calidirosea]